MAVGAAYARTQRSQAVPPFKSTPGINAPFGEREQNVFEAGFDASWEIDVFGGVKRDKEAALADVQAAEEGRREALVTLLADVGRNYLELRGTQQQIRILEETLASQQDTLDIAKARFDAGLGTELDVARAEGLLQANGAERPVLERQARQAIYRISVLLGKHPSALAGELEPPADIPPVPPEIPLALPSELLSRRPDLKRAERELAAATARIGVARADLFPRFSILGSFGRRSEDASDFTKGSAQFWNIVPAVRWPIFSGGRIRANVEVQNARQEQALLQYEKDILTALEEVENALSAHTRERSREASLKAAVDSNSPCPGPSDGPLHERSRRLPLRPGRRTLGLRRGRSAGPQRKDHGRHPSRRLQSPWRRLVPRSSVLIAGVEDPCSTWGSLPASEFVTGSSALPRSG